MVNRRGGEEGATQDWPVSHASTLKSLHPEGGREEKQEGRRGKGV